MDLTIRELLRNSPALTAVNFTIRELCLTMWNWCESILELFVHNVNACITQFKNQLSLLPTQNKLI